MGSGSTMRSYNIHQWSLSKIIRLINNHYSPLFYNVGMIIQVDMVDIASSDVECEDDESIDLK